jgi:hypothetical protein
LSSRGMTSPACYAMPQAAASAGNSSDTTPLPRMPADPPSSDAGRENTIGLEFLQHLLQDQKAIWTSPFHLRSVDADWLVPFGMATSALLATDTERSKHLSNSPTRLKYSNDLSNFGIASMAAADAGFYFLGRFSHDDHKRETGLLAGEAAIDSFAVDYTLKYAFGRQRPLQDNYQGKFWQGGDSFPSEHAAAAWSIASVIAHEYPGPLTTLLAYGGATAISAARISAKQHFPADVFIGSAIGWWVGEHVYRTHHDPKLGGSEWQTYAESHDEGPDRKKTTVGSPYVRLDGWVYPAFERLAALGYLRTEFLGIRPWTRSECARLVEEAGEMLRADQSVHGEAYGIFTALAREFGSEINGLEGRASERYIQLESVYARALGIDGQPLHDSKHFGQTISNDYGRPIAEGLNTVSGLSGWGTWDRFTIYASGEYQHAPSSPTYSDQLRATLSSIDQTSLQSGAFPSVEQFQFLDTYVAANFSDWNFSFGKQSMWWSPNQGSAFLISDNADPMYMFRASRVTPLVLPWVSRWLGPVNFDFFIGKLSGHSYPPRPLIHGEKISIKPTPNLELGFSRTAVFGGVGRPLTLAAFWNTYTSLGSSTFYQASDNPGKRTGAFDVTYRVPLLRNWLTVYLDSISDDDVSPLRNAIRSGINPGFYLPRLPGLRKLDFRAEAVNTAVPPYGGRPNDGHYIYFDSFYHDLYTNKGNIIGSWIGREGMGFQAWSTYWFSPRNSLEFGYRHAKIAKTFIPDGGTYNDGSLQLSWWAHNDLNVSTFVQYEHWTIPLLAPVPQTNWTASVQVAYWPRSWKKRLN